MPTKMPTGPQFLIDRNAQDLRAIHDLLENLRVSERANEELRKELESLRAKAPVDG